ncbi:MAG: transketolase [Candidatus Omnitrophica bacterium]|nr:transketolase [Candidatus Omnitrophota bacterium]
MVNTVTGDYKKIAAQIRARIIKMHAAACASHIGSSFSVVDILVALYFKALKISPDNCSCAGRDRLILSKGHAASALYATLARRGFFPDKVLDGYCVDGGTLPGHSTIGCASAVEVSTGSLGHGLSMGIGMALAARGDKSKHRVFVILSDGECQEGSVWEAAMFAAQHRLDNLIAIVDYNKIQAFGKTNEVVDLEPFRSKWSSFGWGVQEVDGHDFKEIIPALEKVPFRKNKPSVVIAHTIKGKGVSFMENRLLWHYRSPGSDELKRALKELAIK